uniref:Protein kinase domain-containing protein n=1 Tax=Seriola dumerili TaxID=41447 RepID=A0A3B4TGV3_SERDU
MSTRHPNTTVPGAWGFWKSGPVHKISHQGEASCEDCEEGNKQFGEIEVAIIKKLRKLDQDKNNLVRFAEHFEYKGHVCLAFEMLDINIYDFIRSRDFQPLHLSEIRVITQQMLVALNALKSVGLSHADVKPDNIMLVNHQQPFRVKLIGYRAPEVMLGFPLDEAVDMWSLGCVLAFMYLGQNLYPIRCAYQVMRVNDTTESEDTQVDPQKRITLSEALGHRFITMKHFPHDANPNPLMSNPFLVRMTHFHLSDEETASCPSDERPPTRSLDEAKTTNDGTPATADRTARDNNKRPLEKAGLDDATAAETNQKPLHLNEATSPAADLHDSAGDSRSTDERTKGFAKTKNAMLALDGNCWVLFVLTLTNPLVLSSVLLLSPAES